jgi:hypothetical protein
VTTRGMLTARTVAVCSKAGAYVVSLFPCCFSQILEGAVLYRTVIPPPSRSLV